MKIIAEKELSGTSNEAQALDHVHIDIKIMQTPVVVKMLAQKEPVPWCQALRHVPTFSETFSATHTKLSKCKYRSVFFNHVRSILIATDLSRLVIKFFAPNHENHCYHVQCCDQSELMCQAFRSG